MEDTDWFAEYRDPHERCYWRRVGFGIALVIGLALLLFPLAACAPLPQCERPQMLSARLNGEPYILMDTDNAAILLQMVRDLDDRKCKL